MDAQNNEFALASGLDDPAGQGPHGAAGTPPSAGPRGLRPGPHPRLRQPLPAYGLPARPRERRGRHPDLPLASRPVRSGQRLHVRPVGRRRADLSRRVARRTRSGSGRCSTVPTRRATGAAGWRTAWPTIWIWSSPRRCVACSPLVSPLVGAAPGRAVRRRSNRDGWGVGLTILTALGNLVPGLPEEETYLALFHGARRVAADCAGQAPRRDRAPLASTPRPGDPAALAAALDGGAPSRRCRAHPAHRDRGGCRAGGAGRAAARGRRPSASTPTAATCSTSSTRPCECLDLIGWEHAAAVLPSLVGPMVAARGAEESTAWRLPVDLLALVESAMAELPEPVAEATPRGPGRSCRPRSSPAGR